MTDAATLRLPSRSLAKTLLGLGGGLLAIAALCGPAATSVEARVYEMVSPPDKNSSDVIYTASKIRSSTDGERVTFISTGAFPGAAGTGRSVQYLARRGSDRWTTEGITPPQKNNDLTLLVDTVYYDFSENLTHGVLRSPPPSPVAGAPDAVNLFVRQNDSGAYRLITPIGPSTWDPFYQPFYAGASKNFDTIVFESTSALTPNAPDDGLTKLYASVDGDVELVGVLSDESPVAGGSIAGTGARDPSALFQYALRRTKETVSDDGRRIVFTGDPDLEGGGTLYVREGGQTTHISASQRTVPDPPQPSTFRGASANGDSVLFTTAERLLDDDPNNTTDLYRYDVPTGALTRLSADEEPADGDGATVAGVVGHSDDNSHVYFVANGRLVSDAPSTPDPLLYVWHGGSVKYVTSLALGLDVEEMYASWYQGGHNSKVTPDGAMLVFATSQPQPGYDNAGDRQLYLYDATSDAEPLRCVSCVSGTATAAGKVLLDPTSNGVAADIIEYTPRFVTDDGSKVFFTTTGALLPADHNGRADAYEYDVATGALSLVSTGASSDHSYFADASADGEDVFFLTRERLSRWDTDHNLDLYDARAGGGLPEPPLPAGPPCAGDECQGPLAEPPALGVPGSLALSGAGDAARSARARFSVLRLRPARLAALARPRGTKVRVKVSRAGTVSVALKARLGRRPVTVARASRVAQTGGTVGVPLRLSKRARRHLAREGGLRASLTVRFTGARKPVTRTIRLERVESRGAGTSGSFMEAGR